MSIALDIALEGDVNDLMDQILSVSEGLDDTNQLLTQLAINVQNQLRSGRFKDQSGDLRRSMRAYVQDNSLTISMLYYGYFLSFGTRASNRSPLTAEVALVFPGKSGETSFFKQPDNNRGIAARGFYPTNIEEQIVAILEEQATQNL